MRAVLGLATSLMAYWLAFDELCAKVILELACSIFGCFRDILAMKALRVGYLRRVDDVKAPQVADPETTCVIAPGSRSVLATE